MENSLVWNDFKKWWIHQDSNQVRHRFTSSQADRFIHHPLNSSAMSMGNCVIVVMDIRTIQYIYTKANIRLQLLSEREMEIVKHIAKSKSLKQIATELGISFNTVKVHSTKMMQKLQVNVSLEMVNLLRVWGFI